MDFKMNIFHASPVKNIHFKGMAAKVHVVRALSSN